MGENCLIPDKDISAGTDVQKMVMKVPFTDLLIKILYETFVSFFLNFFVYAYSQCTFF